MRCEEYIKVRRFKTVAGYDVWVNMDNVARIWVEPAKLQDGSENPKAGQTALMYNGGVTDHVEESLREVFKYD